MKIEEISALLDGLRAESIKEYIYENVELKRGWSKDYGEKASMLCNAQPNNRVFLVIGVEDNGASSGHSEQWLESHLEKISQHFNHYLDPSVALADLTTEEVNGSKVVIVSLENPGVVVRWDGKAYAGSGTTKQRLEDHEILELSLSLPGLTDFSRKKIVYQPDEEAVRTFAEEVNEESSGELLTKYLVNNNRAGMLLVGGARYRVIKYDRNGSVTSNETRKNLINILAQGMKNEVREYYSQLDVDETSITDELLRESLGNCVAHAAYQEGDGEIILELHPDRLVISNLAYSEYTSLANKWFSSAHKSPNPFLMETLRVLDKVDELGRGKKKLLQECLVNGLRMPMVSVSDAARHKRWSLTLAFEAHDERYRTLRTRLRELYRDDREKSLIAYALVLWRSKSFSEIARYFDTYEGQVAADILNDTNGPLFFWQEKDRLVAHRWVRVLLEDGLASKGFSIHEESRLFRTCKSIQTDHCDGMITPADFRELAHLSNTQSDKNLASRTLSKWVTEGKLVKVKHGTYQFNDKTRATSKDPDLATLRKAFARIIATTGS